MLSGFIMANVMLKLSKVFGQILIIYLFGFSHKVESWKLQFNLYAIGSITKKRYPKLSSLIFCRTIETNVL